MTSEFDVISSSTNFSFDFLNSLKFIQAIGLVTSDDFLARYNLTVETDDVLGYIKNLTWDWNSRKLIHMIHFDDHYGIDFAEMIGPTGFCYNFNMVEAWKILYLDK